MTRACAERFAVRMSSRYSATDDQAAAYVVPLKFTWAMAGSRHPASSELSEGQLAALSTPSGASILVNWKSITQETPFAGCCAARKFRPSRTSLQMSLRSLVPNFGPPLLEDSTNTRPTEISPVSSQQAASK